MSNTRRQAPKNKKKTQKKPLDTEILVDLIDLVGQSLTTIQSGLGLAQVMMPGLRTMPFTNSITSSITIQKTQTKPADADFDKIFKILFNLYRNADSNGDPEVSKSMLLTTAEKMMSRYPDHLISYLICYHFYLEDSESLKIKEIEKIIKEKSHFKQLEFYKQDINYTYLCIVMMKSIFTHDIPPIIKEKFLNAVNQCYASTRWEAAHIDEKPFIEAQKLEALGDEKSAMLEFEKAKTAAFYYIIDSSKSFKLFPRYMSLYSRMALAHYRFKAHTEENSLSEAKVSLGAIFGLINEIDDTKYIPCEFVLDHAFPLVAYASSMKKIKIALEKQDLSDSDKLIKFYQLSKNLSFANINKLDKERAKVDYISRNIDSIPKKEITSMKTTLIEAHVFFKAEAKAMTGNKIDLEKSAFTALTSLVEFSLRMPDQIFKNTPLFIDDLTYASESLRNFPVIPDGLKKAFQLQASIYQLRALLLDFKRRKENTPTILKLANEMMDISPKDFLANFALYYMNVFKPGPVTQFQKLEEFKKLMANLSEAPSVKHIEMQAIYMITHGIGFRALQELELEDRSALLKLGLTLAMKHQRIDVYFFWWANLGGALEFSGCKESIEILESILSTNFPQEDAEDQLNVSLNISAAKIVLKGVKFYEKMLEVKPHDRSTLIKESETILEEMNNNISHFIDLDYINFQQRVANFQQLHLQLIFDVKKIAFESELATLQKSIEALDVTLLDFKDTLKSVREHRSALLVKITKELSLLKQNKNCSKYRQFLTQLNENVKNQGEILASKQVTSSQPIKMKPKKATIDDKEITLKNKASARLNEITHSIISEIKHVTTIETYQSQLKKAHKLICKFTSIEECEKAKEILQDPQEYLDQQHKILNIDDAIKSINDLKFADDNEKNIAINKIKAAYKIKQEELQSLDTSLKSYSQSITTKVDSLKATKKLAEEKAKKSAKIKAAKIASDREKEAKGIKLISHFFKDSKASPAHLAEYCRINKGIQENGGELCIKGGLVLRYYLFILAYLIKSMVELDVFQGARIKDIDSRANAKKFSDAQNIYNYLLSTNGGFNGKSTNGTELTGYIEDQESFCFAGFEKMFLGVKFDMRLIFEPNYVASGIQLTCQDLTTGCIKLWQGSMLDMPNDIIADSVLPFQSNYYLGVVHNPRFEEACKLLFTQSTLILMTPSVRHQDYVYITVKCLYKSSAIVQASQSEDTLKLTWDSDKKSSFDLNALEHEFAKRSFDILSTEGYIKDLYRALVKSIKIYGMQDPFNLPFIRGTFRAILQYSYPDTLIESQRTEILTQLIGILDSYYQARHLEGQFKNSILVKEFELALDLGVKMFMKNGKILEKSIFAALDRLGTSQDKNRYGLYSGSSTVTLVTDKKPVPITKKVSSK